MQTVDSALPGARPEPEDGVASPPRPTAATRHAVPWAVWGFVVGGCALVLLAATVRDRDLRSYLFDALGLAAAGAAVVGILFNRPERRSAWRMFALALALFAAGDVVYDVVIRVSGGSSGSPWADLLYLPAYPLLGLAVIALNRRDVTRTVGVDAAVVTFALATVIWQWAVQPTIATASGSSLDRLLAVAYPILDVLLVAGVVLTLFTFSRGTPSGYLVLTGLAVMLFGDLVYAQLVADGRYVAGGALDITWPVSYFLLAGAALHPSMHALVGSRDARPSRPAWTRMTLLGAALLAAPAVVLLDSSGSGSRLAIGLATTGAAGLVAWRVSRILAESNQAREVVTASEARFRSLVQHAADIIVVVDDQGTVRYVSPAVADVTGRDPEQLLGTPFAEWIDAERPWMARLLEHLERAGGEATVSEELLVRGTTRPEWVEATWTDQRAQPAVRGIVGNLRVVTERKKEEALAAAEHEVLEMILAGTSVPGTLHRLLEGLEAFVGDVACSIRLLDRETGLATLTVAPTLPPEYLERLGEELTRDDLEAHMSPTELSVVESFGSIPARPELLEVPAAFGLAGVWAAPIRSPDGSEILGYLAIYTRSPRRPSAVEAKLVGRVRDLASITIDRADRTRRLDHLALHDTLTGLPNRLLATDRIERAVARLEDVDGAVGVLFVDLDRFKRVNDLLGHELGDELLVAAARRLSASVRREDTVARLGGDEFVVVCEHLESEEQAEVLARRIVDSLAHPFTLERAEVNVSASVGIATTRRSNERASTLLRDADAAMYRAKRRGGSRFELFDEAMQTQAVARMLTERALREAVERDELRIVFQPVFDLRTGEREGIEALLRWDHPVRGLVEAAEFVRVAEETGLIEEIGRWVLDESCRIAGVHGLRGRDGERVPLSVNVSRRQLQRPEFADTVGTVLAAHGVDPTRLTLEVAENALLDDLDLVTDALHALKDLGVRLAIDDFGTGGSSLAYLRRFSFDELKIDRTFTAGLGTSAADDAIVAAQVDMAHALGMVVTAEGVETAEQCDLLRDLGCDRAQGFHLGPPAALAPHRLALVRTRPA